MILMRALKDFDYAQIRRDKGTEFEVSEKIHADILAHGKLAEIVLNKVMKAEDNEALTPPKPIERQPHNPKREYRRRDMVPQK